MKKILGFSILINLILVFVIIFLFNKYSIAKTDLLFVNQSIKVIKKDKKVNSKIDKADPIYIYKSKKFPCDKDSGSGLNYGLCSRERLNYVDSLLNKTVESKIKDFDHFINLNKEGIKKVKNNSYFLNCLRINLAAKDNFIKTQKTWEKMRILNSEEVALGCDGGTGCVGITNDAEIEYVLQRIEEMKKSNTCF